MTYIRTQEHRELMSQIKRKNNGMKGKTHSLEARRKMSESRTGKPSGMSGKTQPESAKQKLRDLWKAKNTLYGTAFYSKIHRWARKALADVKSCQNCNIEGLPPARLHCANISGNYIQDITDWAKLCVPCHHKLDQGIITL